MSVRFVAQRSKPGVSQLYPLLTLVFRAQRKLKGKGREESLNHGERAKTGNGIPLETLVVLPDRNSSPKSANMVGALEIQFPHAVYIRTSSS